MKVLKSKKIYMIGIKGVGMTMLAQFLKSKGIEITGSDTDEIFMSDSVLQKAGIKYFEKFDSANIANDADLIIYSTAYSEKTNIELSEVKKRKTKVISYAEALSDIFNDYFGIAVTGSHGKTTVSAWLGFILMKAGLEPNVMVGANVNQFNGNTLVGKSSYLIIEADEYQNKLQYYNPKAVLLNNIDHDHHDYFVTIDDYKKVFIEFIKKIPKKGFLVANFDDKIIRSIANVNCRGQVISYAIDDAADYVAYGLKTFGDKQFFRVKLSSDISSDEIINKELGDFSISLSGRHNILNALAVIATCVELNIDLSVIRTHLEEFRGTSRRMEILGKYKGANIVDDYAHHPTEIKTTLEGAKNIYKDKRMVVVFHPHTFTRTKALLSEFSKSFHLADELIILDIYGSAREEKGGVSSLDLVQKIKIFNKEISNKKQKVKYIPGLSDCEKYLRDTIDKKDVIILMGAGDIFRIGKNLANN